MILNALRKDLETLLEQKRKEGTNVRSDKHLEQLYSYLVSKLTELGMTNIRRNETLTHPENELISKNFDITYQDEKGMTKAIELKSMNSSYVKNMNNRCEEMWGQAKAAKSFFKLDGYSYVFVLNELEESCAHRLVKKLAWYATDALSDGSMDNFALLRMVPDDPHFVNGFSFEECTW